MTCTDESERWVAHRREHALEKDALIIARDLQDRALSLASVNVDRRLTEMNELRGQINLERGSYVTRLEYETKHEQLVQRIQAMETQFAGFLGRMSVVAALAGLAVSVVVTIVLKVLNV